MASVLFEALPRTCRALGLGIALQNAPADRLGSAAENLFCSIFSGRSPDKTGIGLRVQPVVRDQQKDRHSLGSQHHIDLSAISGCRAITAMMRLVKKAEGLICHGLIHITWALQRGKQSRACNRRCPARFALSHNVTVGIAKPGLMTSHPCTISGASNQEAMHPAESLPTAPTKRRWLASARAQQIAQVGSTETQFCR